MRKINRFAAMLVLGGCLFSSAPAQAEDAASGGVNFSHKIVNPSFDGNTSQGWTAESSTPGVAFNVMEVYNSVFNVFQTITGLPNGPYELRISGFHRAAANDSGSAYRAETEVINVAVYATTTEGTQETVLPSLYSIDGVIVSGTGKLLNGYVDNMEGASQAFAAGHYGNVTVKDLTVTDGSLTIGIKTLGDNVARSWTIWDNFQLFYVGEGSIPVYREMINEIEQKINEYYTNGMIPSGILKDFEGVQAYKAVYYNSEDENELKALLDSIARVEINVDYASKIMDTLFIEVNRAGELEKAHYPGEATLYAARMKAIETTYEDATAEDGNLIYAQELSAAVIVLRTAIVAYRFTQTPSANGLDCTWAMKAPNFTKEEGDPTLTADASSEGWATNNVAESGDFSLNMINEKNCWNSHSADFTSMDVYQELENLPAGLYSFACYQTNNGPSMTDQHAYISAIGGTSSSPQATYSFALDEDPEKGNFSANSKWEGPLATGKVLVGDDGKLRVGFASTSNKNGSSGWFCITDCQLTYYGMSQGAFAEAMENMIEEARELEYSELLPADAAALNAGIKAAGEVDTSDNEAAQAGLNALSKAIATAELAIQKLSIFKNGAYASLVVFSENQDGTYPESVQSLASEVIRNRDALLANDTTSYAALPPLDAQLNTLISFIPLVQKAEGVISNSSYDQDARAKLKEILEDQLEKVKTNLFIISQVETVINYEIKLATLPEEVDSVTGTDVTLWIQNPDFEDSVWDNGWSIDGFGVTTGLQTRDDGYYSNSVETWISYGKTLADKTISQSMYVPDGTYTVTVTATACQQGKIIYYNEDGTVKTDSVIITTPVKGVWLFTNEDSVEIATPMIGESAPYENQTVENEPHSKVFQLANVTVTGHILNFGIKTRSTTANWLGFDNFKLTCLAYSTEGVDDINTESNAPSVWVENGFIKVAGTDDFTVSTASGFEVPATTQLSPGIYLVRVNAHVSKVMVK